ncbi:plasmid pRiA4b ORF-3 family protein [Rhodococcoides kyotonense]|uniref:plasmid pRiA4b ORF-3 family protein n=1 Tax=Rhodococcoides kyotonense TaxID=398843 RepID=UPI001131A7C5|nr:plasmid pRiA4b ORF-3 family protein [Rhodococcus kyotonensis]
MTADKNRRTGANVIPLFDAAVSPLDGFDKWLAETGYDKDPARVISIIESLLSVIGETNTDFAPTAWLPHDAHTLLASVGEIAGDSDIASTMVSMSLDYLAFLDQTGRWTGSADNYAHCVEDLARYLDSVVPQILTPDDIELTPVSPEHELEALSALKPVRQLQLLLAWVGDGKPVTSTGVPRPALIDEFAHADGVELAEGERTVRTVRHVHALATLWDTAVSAGLIKLTSTRAVRVGQTTSLPAVRAAVVHLVRSYFEVDDPMGPFHVANIVAARIVLGAMTDSPPSEPSQTAFTNPDEEAAHSILVGMLRQFEVDGWLTLDGAYDVPMGVRPAVLEALKSVDLSGSIPLEDIERLVVTVRLLETSPPVWRRLELDPELTLGEVHIVLQRAFGWEDTHLHQFLSGSQGHGQTIYGPAEWVDELDGDARVEQDIPIGALLRTPGDTLTYEYDFGDGWEHTITLDAIAPPDPEFVGARCTDGANMTPFEDSGGPWGWNEHLAAAADPGHEQHAESRRWLGLRKNATIDPTEFDLELAADTVAGLFDVR